MEHVQLIACECFEVRRTCLSVNSRFFMDIPLITTFPLVLFYAFVDMYGKLPFTENSLYISLNFWWCQYMIQLYHLLMQNTLCTICLEMSYNYTTMDYAVRKICISSSMLWYYQFSIEKYSISCLQCDTHCKAFMICM